MELSRAERIERIMQRVTCMHHQPRSGPWDNWSRIDLTIQQIKTLAALWGEGSLRMRDLSDLLGVNLSTMTGIVDRLVERRYVERHSDPEDRRIVLVQLSDAGREEIGQIMTLGQTHMEGLLKFIATEDLPVIEQAMDIIFRAGVADRARQHATGNAGQQPAPETPTAQKPTDAGRVTDA